MYLLVISNSSFEKCLFSLFAHFSIGLLVLWKFSFLRSL
jgi:hypothetical protein